MLALKMVIPLKRDSHFSSCASPAYRTGRLDSELSESDTEFIDGL